jgi:DNA-binding response OmpR family regulator
VERGFVMPACGIKILVVDDDPAILRAVCLIAETYGIVVLATSGKAAIEDLKRCEFDLVITDYEMAEGNGMGVATFVTQTNRRCPVIMMTAFGTKDMAIKALNQQIFCFIEKPLDVYLVANCIERGLAKKQASDSRNNLEEMGARSEDLIEKITVPLAKLELTIKRLEEQEPENETLSRNLDLCRTETQKIKLAIEKTRCNLKIKQGDLELENFSFCSLLDSLKPKLVNSLIRNGVILTIAKDAKTIIRGDRVLITHAVCRLIQNAIALAAKHPNKWVTVSVIREKAINKIVVTSGDDKAGSFDFIFGHRLKEVNEDPESVLGLIHNIVTGHGGKFVQTIRERKLKFVIALPVAS